MNSALMLHRHARPAVAGSYFVGSILGATVTVGALFLVSGLLSPIPASIRATAAILGLLLLGARAVGVLCLDLPQRRYQIPRDTFTLAPNRAAFRFAFELGTGVRTYITSSAPYGVAVVLLLCLPYELADATAAAALAASGFGAGRSSIVATQASHRGIAVDHPRQWLRAAELVSLGLVLVVAIRFATAS